MNLKRLYVALFLGQLLLLMSVSVLQQQPGYMDASYYYAGSQRLAEGHGFSELIIWNYLDDPIGMPHPSHSYWMPLASILGAIGIKIFFFLPGYKAAQIFMILFSANLAPLTALIAWEMTRSEGKSWLAGGLALLSGYYLPFMSTTDVFSINLLCGGLAFYLMLRRPRFWTGWLGIVVGLLYLTRADGLIWIGFGGLAILLMEKGQPVDWGGLARKIAGYLAGVCIFTVPWIIRNYLAFGTPLAPGGSRALWIIHYDELFHFPASELTFARWWAAGFPAWVDAMKFAMPLNALTLFAVQGGLLLLPLLLMGLWRFRTHPVVQFGLAVWVLISLEMTLAFPYIGARGGYFHSASAVMTLFWVMMTEGWEWLAGKAAKIRGWSEPGAKRLVAVVMLVVMAVITGFTLYLQFIADVWDEYANRYMSVSAVMETLGIPEDEPVIVNNPPAFFLESGRESYGLPGGGVDMLLSVAAHYDVNYVVIDQDSPEVYGSLLENPVNTSGVSLLWEDEHSRLLLIHEGTE